MKKILTTVIVSVMVIMLFGTSSMAAGRKNVSYYNIKGKKITATGTHYNSKNKLVFNKRSYYTNVKGKKVYVGGKRVFCYDSNGDLCPVNAGTSPQNLGDNYGYGRGYGGGSGCGNRDDCIYNNAS